jgi:hypothetical protein
MQLLMKLNCLSNLKPYKLKIMKQIFLFLLSVVLSFSLFGQAIIINHNCAKLDPIPEQAVLNAKQTLHIAYGHTSHGSQLTDGMTGLIGQSNLVGYKGDIYDWNEGGTDDALDIDDYFASGDLGHLGNTAWATETRAYLDNPVNSDVNVIIWSWCGGCSDNTYEGIQIYLDTMTALEADYPDVKFVYMTGHTDIWSDAVLKANNQHIRDYCINNNKILYDFEDIERYDPDGNYFEFATDNCDYYEDASGSNLLGNWAIEWQSTHDEGIDWYECSAAHTEALNGNLKAYAAWHLWCRLAGWEGVPLEIENNTGLTQWNIYPNPVKDHASVQFKLHSPGTVYIEIIDITGKVYKKESKTFAIEGSHEIDIDLINLPKGVYLCKISTPYDAMSKSFIRI